MAQSSQPPLTSPKSSKTKTKATTKAVDTTKKKKATKRKYQANAEDEPPTKKPKLSSKDAVKAAKGQVQKDQAFLQIKKWTKKSPEEVLALQRGLWKSTVYNHFLDPEISEESGVVKYIFRCKKHPGNPSYAVKRARYDTTTSNLADHVKSCDGKIAPANQTITGYVTAGSYDQGALRVKLALWIARRQRPFVILKDPELVDAFKILNANVVITDTASDDIKEIYQLSIPEVAKALQAHPGYLHLTFDGWTAPNVLSFLGIDVNYCDIGTGSLINMTLDFKPLRNKRHTGTNLASAMMETLRSFGIEKKIFGLVGDNASNNDSMLNALEIEFQDCPAGVSARVRCMCHVLNLVVSAFLSKFKTAKKVKVNGKFIEIEDDEDEDIADDGLEEDEDDEGLLADYGREQEDQDILAAALKDVEDEIDEMILSVSDEDWKEARNIVRNVQKLTKRVHFSQPLRSELELYCGKEQIKYYTLKRTVKSRWNTYGVMFSSVSKVKAAVDRLTKAHKELHSFTAREWKLIRELDEVLKPFVQFTEKMSQNKHRPLIHQVIPLMDIILSKLDKVASNNKYEDTIRMGAKFATNILNKYYALTDDSLVYRSAMLMNPEFKRSYFQVADWPQDWIEAAEKTLRCHWERWYKPVAKATETAVAIIEDDSDDAFAALKRRGTQTTSTANDALSIYLSADTVNLEATNCNGDPLKWWCLKAQDKVEPVDKDLARMAIDLLSIPAASTDVERDFSRGGLMVSKRRHTLANESIRSAMTIAAWNDHDLLPIKSLNKHFSNKLKRVGTQNKREDVEEKGKSKDVIVVDDDDEETGDEEEEEEEETDSDSDSD